MAILSEEAFADSVREALDSIPEQFASLMENVAVVVEASPHRGPKNAVNIRRGDILLGLYEGVPLTARTLSYGAVPPDKITLFQETIEAVGQTPDGIRDLIYETVWHEVGHHFGLSDAALHRAERRRKKHNNAS